MNVAISTTVLGRNDTRTEPLKFLVCCLIFLHIQKWQKNTNTSLLPGALPLAG